MEQHPAVWYHLSEVDMGHECVQVFLDATIFLANRFTLLETLDKPFHTLQEEHINTRTIIF